MHSKNNDESQRPSPQGNEEKAPRPGVGRSGLHGSVEKDELVSWLKEHEHAPRFNYEGTDMLTPEFLDRVKDFEATLRRLRQEDEATRKKWLARRLRDLFHVLKRATLEFMDSEVLDVDTASLTDDDVFALLRKLPFTRRENLAQRPWRHIPIDEPLGDLIVYLTAGTTAEPMKVPSHPVATGCYSPMLKEALRRWDALPHLDESIVGVALVCFQARTVTVATRLQAMGNSAFLKINLMENEWNDPLDPYRYIADVKPAILTGDPFAFAQLAHLGNLLVEKGEIQEQYSPSALMSTALALKKPVREHLESTFNAPVIDLYSLTETGPIAYGCRLGKGYHILPHDIFVEAVDQDGKPVNDGEIGEITVSGGRNPYFPLARYRTGDWGRIIHDARCECGDPMPLIVDLEGRQPVLYHLKGGRWINNRDITAVIENFPVTRFRFHQDSAGRFSLVARLAPFDTTTTCDDLREALAEVLGESPIDVTIDPTLGDRERGKIIPFSTDYALFYD